MNAGVGRPSARRAEGTGDKSYPLTVRKERASKKDERRWEKEVLQGRGRLTSVDVCGKEV